MKSVKQCTAKIVGGYIGITYRTVGRIGYGTQFTNVHMTREAAQRAARELARKRQAA